MPPGSLRRAVETLESFYGPLPEPPRDPFGVFAWHVLGVQATPGRRDAALAALKRIPALTPDAIYKAPRGKVDAAIALAGPAREERGRTLDLAVVAFRRQRDLLARLDASLVEASRALNRLPELSEAGKDWVRLLGASFALVPRDEGVLRVARRLGFGIPYPDGLAGRRTLRSVRAALQAAAGRDLLFVRRTALSFSYHAAGACAPGAPRCSMCPLNDMCRFAAGNGR